MFGDMLAIQSKDLKDLMAGQAAQSHSSILLYYVCAILRYQLNHSFICSRYTFVYSQRY